LVALALVLAAPPTAQADDTQTLVLSCKGTTAGYGTADQRPVSFILHLDFAEKTVETSGLSPFVNGGRVIQTNGKLYFLEHRAVFRGNLDWSFGTLDRVTGVLEGLAITYDGNIANQESLLGGYFFATRCARRTF
jgi:hypothetical protein